MLPKSHNFCGLLIVLFFFWVYPMNSMAEFYKYVDENGHTFYVDDLSKVPQKYMDQVNVYKEKYDHLPADQRKARIEQEQQKQQQEQQQHFLSFYIHLQYLNILANQRTEKHRRLLNNLLFPLQAIQQ